MAKKYREGTGNKRSLAREKLYEEFSIKFWQKTGNCILRENILRGFFHYK